MKHAFKSPLSSQVLAFAAIPSASSLTFVYLISSPLPQRGSYVLDGAIFAQAIGGSSAAAVPIILFPLALSAVLAGQRKRKVALVSGCLATKAVAA